MIENKQLTFSTLNEIKRYGLIGIVLTNQSTSCSQIVILSNSQRFSKPVKIIVE